MSKTSQRTIWPPPALVDSVVDRSYLAYLRPTPQPFYQFSSGHFPPGTFTQPHSHPCLAVHGGLRGQFTLVTAQGDVTIDEATFCLLPPGLRHHWRNKSRHTASNLVFLIDAANPGPWPRQSGVPEACRQLAEGVRHLQRFQLTGDTDLQHLYWQLTDRLMAERLQPQAVVAGLLGAFVGLLVERLQPRGPAVQQRTEVAQEIRRLLLARLEDRLSIEEVAAAVRLSASRAKEIFREAFGCGIISYFTQLKLWKAKRLLCDPALTIEQVSDKLGFSSPSYFSRVFQRHVGVSPTDFRQREDTSPRTASPHA